MALPAGRGRGLIPERTHAQARGAARVVLVLCIRARHAPARACACVVVGVLVCVLVSVLVRALAWRLHGCLVLRPKVQKAKRFRDSNLATWGTTVDLE
jgi:hypothetical protein